MADELLAPLPAFNPEDQREKEACKPLPVVAHGFNPFVSLPYGLTTDHVSRAMDDLIKFISLINRQLNDSGFHRLESLLMPANFSSIIGEFIGATLPKYCSGLVRNQYHNGHPDLLPAGMYPHDAVRHVQESIEIKGSRRLSGWQGHNRENLWLMVFVFDCNGQADILKGIGPKPFRFVKVVGAQLTESDWTFSGRSATSRRTITASVAQSGYQKMHANWIYQDPCPTPDPS